MQKKVEKRSPPLSKNKSLAAEKVQNLRSLHPKHSMELSDSAPSDENPTNYFLKQNQFCFCRKVGELKWTPRIIQTHRQTEKRGRIGRSTYLMRKKVGHGEIDPKKNGFKSVGRELQLVKGVQYGKGWCRRAYHLDYIDLRSGSDTPLTFLFCARCYSVSHNVFAFTKHLVPYSVTTDTI